jgi:hypothetical protein
MGPRLSISALYFCKTLHVLQHTLELVGELLTVRFGVTVGSRVHVKAQNNEGI